MAALITNRVNALSDAFETAAILGDVLAHNPTHLGTVFRHFIEAGTIKRILKLSEIKVYLDGDFAVNATDKDKLTLLLNNGTCLIDALLYLTGDNTKMTKKPVASRLISPVYHDLATNKSDLRLASKFMAAAYLWILFRANWPSGDSKTLGPGVPTFIANILSTKPVTGESPFSGNEISANLASFELEDLDPSWVASIPLEGLGPETKNRIAVGIAGYRYIKIFGAIRPDNEVPAALVGAHKLMFRLARQPESWDIHPSTRAAEVSSFVKSINKGASNMMLLLYKQETLRSWAKGKMIPVMPKPHSSETGFMSWKPEWAMNLDRSIFGQPFLTADVLDADYDAMMGSATFRLPVYDSISTATNSNALAGVIGALQGNKQQGAGQKGAVAIVAPPAPADAMAQLILDDGPGEGPMGD